MIVTYEQQYHHYLIFMQQYNKIICAIIENVANRDEFDGDSDAGVYNPVVLPWKNR